MRGSWTDLSKADQSILSPSKNRKKKKSGAFSTYLDYNHEKSHHTHHRASITKILEHPEEYRVMVKGSVDEQCSDGNVSEESGDSNINHILQGHRIRDSVDLTSHNSPKTISKSSDCSHKTPESKAPTSSSLLSPVSILVTNSKRNKEKTESNPKKKTREIVVTEEMLEKHSYHYYLINNFFLSDSSSEDSLHSPDDKIVTFDEALIFIGPTGSPLSQRGRVNFGSNESSPCDNTFNPHCACQEKKNHKKFAYIHVAGSMFQTQWSTLDRHPTTLLGSKDREKYYDPKRKCFLFSSSRQDCFESILFYYQEGILRPPKNVKEQIFYDELEFFRISPDEITLLNHEVQLQEEFDALVPENPDSLQTALYLLLYHNITIKTQIFTVVDICFILTSVISSIVATQVPIYMEKDQLPYDEAQFYKHYGATKPFIVVDATCSTWFLLTFILHFYAAPCKKTFLLSFQAAVDMMIVTAFFLSVSVANTTLALTPMLQHVIRLIFSLRVLKLSRHSLLLNSLGLALKEASRELISVLLFVFVIVFIFGCLEYHVEVREPSLEQVMLLLVVGLKHDSEL